MLGLSRSIGLRQTLPAAAAFRRSLASVTLSNPNPPSEPDHFFHLGLGSDDDIKARFGDTKFFCTGGSASRIELFAHKAAKALGHEAVGPIGKTDRYVMYKVGPVLMANHGMGMPTTSILLHEVRLFCVAAPAPRRPRPRPRPPRPARAPAPRHRTLGVVI